VAYLLIAVECLLGNLAARELVKFVQLVQVVVYVAGTVVEERASVFEDFLPRCPVRGSYKSDSVQLW